MMQYVVLPMSRRHFVNGLLCSRLLRPTTLRAHQAGWQVSPLVHTRPMTQGAVAEREGEGSLEGQATVVRVLRTCWPGLQIDVRPLYDDP